MSEVQSESLRVSQINQQFSGKKNKVFQFEKGVIQYCNMEQTIVSKNIDSQLAVHNYLCYQQDDKLVKITEILLQNKILRIKDELKIITQVNQGEPEQKKRLGVFGRRNNYTDPSKEQKSDTKNLIKNIINLFSNWLHLQKNQIAQRAHRKLKRIIAKMKYFNKLLIQQLCLDKEISECFIQFQKTTGQLAIQNSRIKDKSCHLKAMRNYAKIFEQARIKKEKIQDST